MIAIIFQNTKKHTYSVAIQPDPGRRMSTFVGAHRFNSMDRIDFASSQHFLFKMKGSLNEKDQGYFLLFQQGGALVEFPYEVKSQFTPDATVAAVYTSKEDHDERYFLMLSGSHHLSVIKFKYLKKSNVIDAQLLWQSRDTFEGRYLKEFAQK